MTMLTPHETQIVIINAIQDIHYMDAENISNIIVDYLDEEEMARIPEKEEVRLTQLYRRKIYKTLPLDIWKGRSKLARYINHCGRHMNEDFTNLNDEYRAMEMVKNSYNKISKADFKKHGDKWLYEFFRDFEFDYTTYNFVY